MTHARGHRLIRFSEYQRAVLVEVKRHGPHRDSAGQHAAALLGLQRVGAVILLSGGATLEPRLAPYLRELLERALLPFASEHQAVIIDGGTDAGVMALMGQALAGSGRSVPLIGVAPSRLVSYPDGEPARAEDQRVPLERNHTHFVLVEGARWGDETAVMIEVALALGEGLPTFLILANGGEVSKAELLQSSRRGVHMIILDGTGRLAEQIAQLRRGDPPETAEPELHEVLAYSALEVLPAESSPETLRASLCQKLAAHQLLRDAWESFALYDANAQQHQRIHYRIQNLILLFGFLATVLALSGQLSKGAAAWLTGVGLPLWCPSQRVGALLGELFKGARLVAPIALSTLIAAATFLQSGSRWLVLRASAEAIKREIFRHRAEAVLPPVTEQASGLAERVRAIRAHLMETDVGKSALRPCADARPPRQALAAGDEGFLALPPPRYLELRLADQRAYYQKKIVDLQRHLLRGRLLILLIGGVGTLLVALNLDLGMALAASATAAVATWLAHRRVEDNLLLFNRSAAQLANLYTWWTALPEAEKRSPARVRELVNSTEAALQGEATQWLEAMQQAQAPRPAPGAAKAPAEQAPAAGAAT